jgi:hypothetical protein
MKVARASRSGFENNPDRDGLATVWTPAAFDGLAHIRLNLCRGCRGLGRRCQKRRLTPSSG